MILHFTKMNGAGNDFVMLDNRELKLNLSRPEIAALCDRHRGIGADGLICVERATGEGDFRMRYYNADGGEAEMCGNGARCFGRFVNHLHQGSLSRVRFETLAGLIEAELIGNEVRLEMSQPHGLQLNLALQAAGAELCVHRLNTGVPHAVVVVPDLAAVEVRTLGSALRHHQAFAPKGSNANFMVARGPSQIAIRTYERGVEDETLACGTGMVACALIHHELSGEPGPIAVTVAGGDTLRVGFERVAAGEYRKVTLLGPADITFSGQIRLGESLA
jgi:diaminopimelate epimerase